MKTPKGFGNDNVSNYFQKLALPYINCSLVCMHNKSTEKGEFTNHWKMARATTHFKGDKSSKVNYRPISVLLIVSRVFEKPVYNQLYEYLNTNSLLPSSQSGFRAMHSTTTALSKCTDDSYSGLDLGKFVGVVYVDMKRAFDTVDHKILLHKLAFKIMAFKARSFCGLNHTFLTEANLQGLMELILPSKTKIWGSSRFMSWPFVISNVYEQPT